MICSFRAALKTLLIQKAEACSALLGTAERTQAVSQERWLKRVHSDRQEFGRHLSESLSESLMKFWVKWWI